MKKFFTLAAIAAVAMTASAQSLYMTGASSKTAEEGGLPANWAPSNPAEFAVVDGNYQITINGLQTFKISTAKSEVEGEWGDAETGFNSGVLTCNYGKEAGAVVALEPGDGASPNINCPWEGDWTVVVAGDLSTITMTTTTPKPDDDGIKLYFRGDMNGWGSPEEWMFEQVSDNVFKFVCGEGQQVGLGEAFKIADGTWTEYNFGAMEGEGAILLDVDTELNGGTDPGNLTLEEVWNGICWFTLEGNYVVFSNDVNFKPEWVGDTAVEEVEVAEGEAQYFTLQGVRVANPENGLYIVVKGNKAYKTILK